MKAIRTIGFTGTIASGKSSRCKHLVEIAKQHQQAFVAAANISNKPPQSAAASTAFSHPNNSVLVHYINADLVGHNIYEPGKPCYKALVQHFGKSILCSTPPHTHTTVTAAATQSAGDTSASPPAPSASRAPAAASTAATVAVESGGLPFIDRRVLGNMVFADEHKLQELSAICWPYISQAIRAQHAAVVARATGAAFPPHLDPTALLTVPPGPPAAVAIIIIEAALLCDMTDVLRLTTDLWMTHCTPLTAVDRLMARNGFSREAAEQRVTSQREVSQKLQSLREVSYTGDIEVFDTTSISLKDGLKETERAFEKYWQNKVLVHLSHE